MARGPALAAALAVSLLAVASAGGAATQQAPKRGGTVSTSAALFAWITNGGRVAWPDVWCGHALNFGGYCERLVQRDLKQTDFIVGQRQRARVLNAADRKLARAVPVLPIVQGAIQYAVRDTIRGMTRGGTGHFFQATEDWWLAEPR